MGTPKIAKIPIEQIEDGIIKCLQNSRRINKMAKALLQDWKPTGQIDVKQHDSTYSIVLFYYAVEELGKAIRLEDHKKEKESNNEKYVDDVRLFTCHDYKTEIAQKRYPELMIPKWEKKFTKKNTYQLVPHGEVINDFVERSNCWLVGYNEDLGKWVSILQDVDNDEIAKRLGILDKILDEWQNTYTYFATLPKHLDYYADK